MNFLLMVCGYSVFFFFFFFFFLICCNVVIGFPSEGVAGSISMSRRGFLMFVLTFLLGSIFLAFDIGIYCIALLVCLRETEVCF